MEKFTADNFKKGFLMDDELMAGISEVKETPGTFNAYIVKHTTGEVVGSQNFENLFEAIRTLNGVTRPWAFRSVSRCGSGNCSKGGCGKNDGCGKKAKSDEGTEAGTTTESSAGESAEGGSCGNGSC